MSKHDYDVARRLIDQQGISFRALVMAALAKSSDKTMYRLLREGFPDIAREYWDRHDGVWGFLPSENKAADYEYMKRDAAITEEIMRDPRLKDLLED